MLRFPIMVLAITFIFTSAGCVGKSPTERMGGGGGGKGATGSSVDAVKLNTSRSNVNRMGGGGGKGGATP
jgi:hypothetical protein